MLFFIDEKFLRNDADDVAQMTLHVVQFKKTLL